MNNNILTIVVIAALVITGVGSFVGKGNVTIDTSGLEAVLGTALNYEAAQSQLVAFNFLQDVVEDLGSTATSSWNPGAIDIDTSATTSVTVTGAALGDFVEVSFDSSTTTDQWKVFGNVQSADTVWVTMESVASSSVNLTASTLYVRVTSSTLQSSVSSSP